MGRTDADGKDTHDRNASSPVLVRDGGKEKHDAESALFRESEGKSADEEHAE
jgi:hypothetical protein